MTGRDLATGSSGTGGADIRGCPDPRHCLDGHAWKCLLLGSCRGQGQRGPWILPRTGQPEMGEDPLNYGRVVDHRNQLHPPGGTIS